ncbi:hypothetical protein BO78DRAFT_270050, partial [Aspergillus sclerotiicarbonarius CBS 121057]
TITTPCERIIAAAERTNRLNGHENAGFLSKAAGFAPLHPTTSLPPPHAAWDTLASALPHLVQTQTVRETITNMPVLDASPSALPDKYLQRAATILGMTAHVYVRMQGSEPLTQKYASHRDILPASLEIPWTLVCKRLGRDTPSLTYVDGVVANFTTTSKTSPSAVTLDTISLLVPTVNTIEERTFIGIMIEINAKTIPIIHEIIHSQRAVLSRNPPALKQSLHSLLALLKDVTRSLSKLNANRAYRGHIDPVLWTLTVANLGIPWVKDAVGAAGTAHPFFHMMDEFTGREKYGTGIGKEARVVREMYPVHWRGFLGAVREVSVGGYVAEVVKEGGDGDGELGELWTALKEAYHGDQGLLGFHRRKVFGFLAVSFRIGRSTTINGLGRKRRAEPWMEADSELDKARVERRGMGEGDGGGGEGGEREGKGERVLMVSELIRHNSEEMGYWFAAQGSVYDGSGFMMKHPGGDTVMALCSGQDVTESLRAVGHLTHPATRKKMEMYRIGRLEGPKLASGQVKEMYLAAVELGQKAAEMENVYRRNFQLLDGKLTVLDEPEVLTAKKARHLLDAKNRLQDEHVPAMAMLLDALLERMGEFDGMVDVRAARAEMAGLVAPERTLGTATRYENYGMAVDTVQTDLGRLTEVKECVAMVLETVEDQGFTCSDHSRVQAMMDTL